MMVEAAEVKVVSRGRSQSPNNALLKQTDVSPSA